MKGTKYMRIFEILDNENSLSIGVLLYYEKEKTFVIELQDYLDEWNAPLLFSGIVKKGNYTIPRAISFLWVKERIIPSGRQNINSILNTHKLKEYDEMKFLELSGGRCSQDEMYIKKLDEVPDFVQKRLLHNLIDLVPLRDNNLLCFFVDGSVRKIDLSSILDEPGIDKVMRNAKLYESGKVGTGGYYATFNDSIDIPSWLLYKSGKRIPLEYEDFITFVRKNIYDTADCCYELECTRQNLSYMVKQNQLSPIKEDVKGNLYLKSEVIKNRW